MHYYIRVESFAYVSSVWNLVQIRHWTKPLLFCVLCNSFTKQQLNIACHMDLFGYPLVFKISWMRCRCLHFHSSLTKRKAGYFRRHIYSSIWASRGTCCITLAQNKIESATFGLKHISFQNCWNLCLLSRLQYLHDWTVSNKMEKQLFFYQYYSWYVRTCIVFVFALIYDHSLAIRTHVTGSMNSLYVSNSWVIQRNRTCLGKNLNCSHSLFCTCKYCEVESETSLSCGKYVILENHG